MKKKAPKGTVAKAIVAGESAIVTAAETAGDTLGRAVQAAGAAMDSELMQKGRKSAATLRKRVTAFVAKARAKAKTRKKKATARKKTAGAGKKKRAAAKRR